MLQRMGSGEQFGIVAGHAYFDVGKACRTDPERSAYRRPRGIDGRVGELAGGLSRDSAPRSSNSACDLPH